MSTEFPLKFSPTPESEPSSADIEQEDSDPLGSPEVRERLKRESLAFVQKISTSKRRPGALVFLDRSARPAAWLFQSLWKGLYPDLPCPQIKFINIGREKFGTPSQD